MQGQRRRLLERCLFFGVTVIISRSLQSNGMQSVYEDLRNKIGVNGDWREILKFMISARVLRINSNLVIHVFRDLKQGRRRRLGERNKFAYSVGKNNSFARPARAFHILIHFFGVLVLTTTWNDQIWGHVEDESTWRRIFKFLFKCPHRSHQFYSWIAHSHFPSRTTWSNRKIITVTGNNIFRQRSRSRRRRPCLRTVPTN